MILHMLPNVRQATIKPIIKTVVTITGTWAIKLSLRNFGKYSL